MWHQKRQKTLEARGPNLLLALKMEEDGREPREAGSLQELGKAVR